MYDHIAVDSHILGLYKKMELVIMQVTNHSQLVQEALKQIDALPTVPQRPSSMNLPLTSMDEVDLAETALKNTETFDATMSIAALLIYNIVNCNYTVLVPFNLIINGVAKLATAVLPNYKLLSDRVVETTLYPLASISGGPGGGATSGLTLKGAKYVWPSGFFDK